MHIEWLQHAGGHDASDVISFHFWLLRSNAQKSDSAFSPLHPPWTWRQCSSFVQAAQHCALGQMPSSSILIQVLVSMKKHGHHSLCHLCNLCENATTLAQHSTVLFCSLSLHDQGSCAVTACWPEEGSSGTDKKPTSALLERQAGACTHHQCWLLHHAPHHCCLLHKHHFFACIYEHCDCLFWCTVGPKLNLHVIFLVWSNNLLNFHHCHCRIWLHSCCCCIFAFSFGAFLPWTCLHFFPLKLCFSVFILDWSINWIWWDLSMQRIWVQCASLFVKWCMLSHKLVDDCMDGLHWVLSEKANCATWTKHPHHVVNKKVNFGDDGSSCVFDVCPKNCQLLQKALLAQFLEHMVFTAWVQQQQRGWTWKRRKGIQERNDWRKFLQLKQIASVEENCFNWSNLLQLKQIASFEAICFNWSKLLQLKQIASIEAICFTKHD